MPWECLHHELISDDIIQKLQEELTSSVGPNIHGAYEEISSKTKIKLYEDGNKHKLESIDSIDYEPESLKSLENFHALLIEEAVLQKITGWQTFDNVQQQLREQLAKEQWLAYILSSLSHSEAKEGKLYFIEQAIPCILHLENCTSIEKLMLLFVEGLSGAQGKTLDGYVCIQSMDEREKHFIEAVSHAMNQEILGSDENVGQWKLPMEKVKGEQQKIGTINVENYCGRVIMSNCDKLIDKCIPGDAKKCKWKYAIVMYNAAMKILGKKSNYTVDEKKNPIVCQYMKLFINQLSASHPWLL